MVGSIVKSFLIINKKVQGIIGLLGIIFMDLVVMMKLRIDFNGVWNKWIVYQVFF